MAVEDIEWQERYGDQSYKPRSLLAIRVALLSLFFSQMVVLPSLAVYLSSLHADTTMLGYCLAATCIGELCFNSLFSIWYDKRPAREVVVGALLLNTFACIAYATAPHHFFVLISRFIAGAAAGVQAPLMTMVGAFTNRYNRAEILGTVRSTYLLAFILGAGFSTSVTFVHMVNPGLPLDSMEYSVPHYVRESKTAVKDEVDSATKGTKNAMSDAAAAASRVFDNVDNVTQATSWQAPFLSMVKDAGPESLGKELGLWDTLHKAQYTPHNATVTASMIPSMQAAGEALLRLLQPLANTAATSSGGGSGSSKRAKLTAIPATPATPATSAASLQMQAAARKAGIIEAIRLAQERQGGLPTYTSGPVFHAAATAHTSAAGGGAGGGAGASSQWAPAHFSGQVAAVAAGGREVGAAVAGGGREIGAASLRLTAAVQSNLQAIFADISQRERAATRALQQEHAKSADATRQVPAGGAELMRGGDVTLAGGGEDAMQKDMEVVKAAFDPHLHLHDVGKRMEEGLDAVRREAHALRRLFPHAQPPSASAFPADAAAASVDAGEGHVADAAAVGEADGTDGEAGDDAEADEEGAEADEEGAEHAESGDADDSWQDPSYRGSTPGWASGARRRLLAEAFGARRRLLGEGLRDVSPNILHANSKDAWGFAQWVEELPGAKAAFGLAEEAEEVQEAAASELEGTRSLPPAAPRATFARASARASATTTGGGVALAEADADNSTNGNASVTSWQGFGGEGGGGSNVETDAELEKNIGDGSYYLPSYFTALVGRGLKAPGYLGAVASIIACFFVWFNLVEGPRKALTKRVPLAHLSPRSLAYFYPLTACAALELVAQASMVSMETLVVPLLRLWHGWSCDALAVFLMAVATSGVVGLAVLDALKKRVALRRLLFISAFFVMLGFSLCFTWDADRPSAWKYCIGCCIGAFGFFPLSSVANEIVSVAVIKMYSEDGELIWLELFWAVTRSPARAVGPIVLIHAFVWDPTGNLCYLILAGLASGAILLLFALRTTLITDGVADDAQVLPGAHCTPSSVMTEEAVRYGPLAQD